MGDVRALDAADERDVGRPGATKASLERRIVDSYRALASLSLARAMDDSTVEARAGCARAAVAR